jgi:uncharacterized protein (DUF1810 family)
MRVVLHTACPSCGLTRAARAVLHGDLAGATRLHPLWWVIFPYLAALGAAEAYAYVTTGKTGAYAARPIVHRAGAAILVALILVWGARAAGALGGPAPI